MRSCYCRGSQFVEISARPLFLHHSLAGRRSEKTWQNRGLIGMERHMSNNAFRFCGVPLLVDTSRSPIFFTPTG